MSIVSDPVLRSSVAPLLAELDRIAAVVESRRAAEDRARIEALTREISQLRAVVAHLRAGAGPLPASLRPAVARAALEAAESAEIAGG